ncbi:MAG TPA: tryptophan halogenase family protein [Steroidobacteraceae bacterium]|nr:tryptophan halogenase family protein [Steroidobacteraceae bacterium]
MNGQSVGGNGSAPLRIVILGGGTAGWMSAAAFRRQLPAQDYSITLVESDEIGTVGVGEATLPSIKGFNDLLGIDESDFMRRTRATFKLGIEFCGWDREGERYVHPFGAFGEPWGGVEFQHHWFRARLAGLKCTPLQDYSFSVVAALSNVFEPPEADSKSIRSTYSYAYHFDAGLYAAYLRSWAIERGAQRIEGRVSEVRRHPETGNLTELILTSGVRVEGDLFIDCSGFRAVLLGGTLGVPWQDWTHWLPCDRALAVACPRTDPLLPYTRATARSAGWCWRIPLQHRTGNGYVFSSRFIGEDEAAVSLLAGLEAPAMGEPRLLRFSAGRRERAWSGNCVALGLASGFLEPLESTSIYLMQAAIIDLLHLMPDRRAGGIDPRLVAEFNRLAEWQYERIRDFLVLHYTANRRFGEPLWDFVRSMTLPETLRHKLELFRSRSALPNYEYGLFSRDSWLAVLAGQGIVPNGYDRVAEGLPLDRLEARLAEFHGQIHAGVARMRSHGEYVASYCAASEAQSLAGATV